MNISGGGDTARENIKRFHQTKEIEGVVCRVEPTDASNMWGEPLNNSYQIPDGGNQKFAVSPAMISIEDWLELGRVAAAVHEPVSMEIFRDTAYDETVEMAKMSVESGNAHEIPTPTLRIETDYRFTMQEGRSRAVGAEKAGLDWIPVWIVGQEY